MIAWSWSVIACALLFLVSQPAAAADGFAELVPPNSEYLLVVQVKQVLASDLYEKHGKAMKALIEQLKFDDAGEIIAKAGVDWSKDIDRIVLVGTRTTVADTKQTDEMIVVCGNFDGKKLLAAAAEYAGMNKDTVAVIREGPYQLVKFGKNVQTAEEATLYGAVVDSKRLILCRAKKEVVLAALDRAANHKPPVVKDKEMLKALVQIDPMVSVLVWIPRSELTGSWADTPVAAKLIEKTKFLMIEVRVTTDIKIILSAEMADADAAKEVKPRVVELVDQLKAAFEFVVTADPRAKPFVEMMKTVEVSTKGRAVILRGTTSAEAIEALLKLARKEKP